MKIILLSDDSLRLEPTPGPLTIEAPTTEQAYSPFHMMASALAYCTLSVLHAWAESARLDVGDLALEVAWTFADDPHRVASYDVSFDWPSLPERRLDGARRVAEMCTVHATLQHPPAIAIRAKGEPARVGAGGGR